MRTCRRAAGSTPGPEAGSDPERQINTDQSNVLIHQQYKKPAEVEGTNTEECKETRHKNQNQFSDTQV